MLIYGKFWGCKGGIIPLMFHKQFFQNALKFSLQIEARLLFPVLK